MAEGTCIGGYRQDFSFETLGRDVAVETVAFSGLPEHLFSEDEPCLAEWFQGAPAVTGDAGVGMTIGQTCRQPGCRRVMNCRAVVKNSV